MDRLGTWAVGIALALATAAQAEIIVNDARPITHRVTVQLIQTALDNGSSPATVFGNANQRSAIEAAVDTIWAQAGIDILFLPDLVRYNDTFAYQGTSGSGTRPTSDLTTIRTNAGREGGILHSDSSVLNMFMVNVAPGFKPLSENSAAGLARIAANGIAAYVGDNLLTFANGRDVIASVMAHEIGHNLGLSHTSTGGANLMSPSGTTEQLTQSQINSVFNATSFVKLLPDELPGDLNGDGAVDAADYTTWRDGLGTIYTAQQYDVWKSNFGRSLNGAGASLHQSGLGATGSASVVPEPPTNSIVFLAVSIIIFHRRLAPRFFRSRHMNGFHRVTLRVCLFISVAAVSNITCAAEYFVDPTGNDAAAGDAAAPWQTLQFAANQVVPGDRVTVRPGNYAGFHLTTSGTAVAPIEFFAESGVLVNQPNPARTDHGINLENASHVIIDGFAVTGMNRAGVRSVGVDGDTFASHVTIRNTHAYDNGRWGILTGFVDDLVIENNETSGSVLEHGIYVSNSGDRPTIRNNISWGNHANGIHMNGDASLGGDGIITGALVSGNIIYGNGTGGGSGINMDGVQDSRIENNLIFDHHSSGISLYRIDGGGGANNNVVVNNTIHVASDGRWALNIQDGSTGNQVFNNILLNDHPSRGAIDVCGDCLAGFESDYNVVVSRFTSDDTNYNLAQWQAATGNDLHSIVAAAGNLFVNTAAGDYHLLGGAPARDAGTTTLAPMFDLDGKPRPIGSTIDVGAYEFGPAPLTGDFNADGAVDAADYTMWRDGLGTAFTADQYDDWKNNFGNTLTAGARASEQTPGSAGGLFGSVPEPDAAILCVLFAGLLSGYRLKFVRKSRIC